MVDADGERIFLQPDIVDPEAQEVPPLPPAQPIEQVAMGADQEIGPPHHREVDPVVEAELLPQKPRGIGDIDLADLEADIEYWRNITNEYKDQYGEICDEINFWLDKGTADKSEIDRLLQNRGESYRNWDKCNNTFKDAIEAKDTYVNFYSRYYKKL